MINLDINEMQLARTIDRAREKNIIIPPMAWQKNPQLIPEKSRRNCAMWSCGQLIL